MGVIIAATAAAVAAGASAYGAKAKNDAAKKAASAQKDAIAQQQSILQKKLDPEALNRLAQQMDRERALNRKSLQAEVDPELAKLRDLGAKNLLSEAERDINSFQSQQAANEIFKEGINQDPRLEALKTSIIQRAQEDLSKGAELPPTFQAELVRAGITAGSQAGIGVSKGAVGGPTARLLGQGGIDLERQRTAEATALTGAAQSLTDSRQRILQNIFPTVKAAEEAKTARDARAFAIGEATLPESGLSGTEGVNIEIGRQKGRANLAAQIGQVNAAKAAAQGQYQGALAGAAASGIGGILGAYGGTGGYGALAKSITKNTA